LAAGERCDFTGKGWNSILVAGEGHAAKRVARLVQEAGIAAAAGKFGRESLCASEVIPSATARFAATKPGCAWGVADRCHPPGRRNAMPRVSPTQARMSLSTSGTSERQFEAGGQMLSHILDPRTGWPLGGFRSVTAVARSGRRTEALSKHLLSSRLQS